MAKIIALDYTPSDTMTTGGEEYVVVSAESPTKPGGGHAEELNQTKLRKHIVPHTKNVGSLT